MYRTAKDLTVLELNFKAKLKQLGSNNNKLEIMQKRNEFKDKKSDLEQERKYEEKLFTSQVKTIQEEYNKFEIPEEYKFSEIDSEKYAIGLTALSLMNFNIKTRYRHKKSRIWKITNIKSLEELSKKNQNLQVEFEKKQFVSNQKSISRELKEKMQHYFDHTKEGKEVSEALKG